MDEMEFGPLWGFSSDNSKKRQVEKYVETEDSDASQEKTAQSLMTKTLKRKLQEAWVQCEKPDCLKWRSIPKSEAKALGDKPWFCHMNENLRYSSCDVPEEDTLEAEEMVERCRLVYIRSILPGGSLVWAKMPGYCWWPGLVVVDVDYGISVAVDCDGDPLSYHIEFLGPKRSHAWIPEHMVEIYGEHVPFDPSSGRQEKTSGIERTIFKGFSVKEAIKEATSFQTLTLKERLSRCHFLSSAPVTGGSKPRRDNRKTKTRQHPGLDSSKEAVHTITVGLDEQINSQCDVKKKRKKTEHTSGKKLPKKDAAKEKNCSDGEPVAKIPKLIRVQKSEKLSNRSGDQLPSEEKSKSDVTTSMEKEHNSSVARNDPEDSDFHDSRVVPDVDDVQRPANEKDSVQKLDAKQTSKLKAGKPSFMVPSSGSSKPLENKRNNGSKKGFCPPVKTKALQNSSAATPNRQVLLVTPKAAAKEETRPTATVAEDQIMENDGERVGNKGQKSCSGGEVNEVELSIVEEASAFDELADEVCSVAAQEEGQALQQLLHQSVSLVGRTKEEKFAIDVQTYKENHDRFEEVVRKFMSQNKQRSQKLPVWENRCIGLFELFLAIHERGGYDTVCQKRLWTEIYSELTGISTAKRNSKAKNYYKRYLLPYELYINGSEYEHLFTKAEAEGEPKAAKKPSKSSGKTEEKTSVKKKHSKKSDAIMEQREAKLQPEDADDVESESAELEKLMLDLKEYDTLCQSQVSACLQHDVTGDPTTPKKKLTSTPARKPGADMDYFLCDMEERLSNDDNDGGVHIVPLACTLSPVFNSDHEESCELEEMEALKHELISMQQHLDEMNSSLL